MITKLTPISQDEYSVEKPDVGSDNPEEPLKKAYQLRPNLQHNSNHAPSPKKYSEVINPDLDRYPVLLQGDTLDVKHCRGDIIFRSK